MTKAQTYAVPRWLRARVKVWQNRCDLNSWEIIVSMRKLPGDMIALTTYTPGYKNCLMEFDPVGYEQCNDAEMDRRIAHEMYHLLVSIEETALGKYIGDGHAFKAYTDAQEHVAEEFGAIMVKAYRRKKA